MRPILLDYRDTMAVFEVFDAVDTNFDAGCHGSVVVDGCITSPDPKIGATKLS